MRNFLEKAKFTGISALTGVAGAVGVTASTIVNSTPVSADSYSGTLVINSNANNRIIYNVAGAGECYDDFLAMTINGEWVFCTEPHIATNSGVSYSADNEILSSNVVVRTGDGGTSSPNDWTKMQAIGIYWAMLKADRQTLVDLFGDSTFGDNHTVGDIIDWFRSQDSVTQYGILQMLTWNLFSGGKNEISVVSTASGAANAVAQYYGHNFSSELINATAIHWVGNNIADMWQNGTLTYDNNAYFLYGGSMQRLLTTGGTFSLAKGSVSMTKVSANPDATSNNDAYSLEGAVYTLSNASNSYTLTTDASGNASLSDVKAGTYTLVETTAPKGYQLNTNSYEVVVKAGQNTAIPTSSTTDTPILGSIDLQKESGNTTLSTGNSNYSLEGAVYTATGKTSGKVYTLTTDSTGYAKVSDVVLDDYTVVETLSPEKGYVLSNFEYTVSVTGSDTYRVRLSASDNSIYDELNSHEVTLAIKKDSDLGNLVHGDASIVGATYEVRFYEDTTLTSDTVANATPYMTVSATINKDGNLVIPLSDDALWSLTQYLDDDLKDGTTINAPIGSYAIVETQAPTGYTLDTKAYVYNVTDSGSRTTTDPLTAGGNAETANIAEKVIRGGVQVIKSDAEIGKSEAIGGKDHSAGSSEGTDLNGITFEITNKSANSVYVDGKEYQVGEVVKTITTSWNAELGAYTAQTDADTLPYGTYSIKEVSSNDSYNLTDTAERTFEIRENGVVVTTDTSGTTLNFSNQVVRGDFEFNKIVDTTSDRLSTAFIITNTTNGEQHLIVTDKNGEYSSTGYNHTSNTNANDTYLEKALAGETIAMSDLNMKAGTWFGNAEDGSTASANDSLGALPYGKYTLQEVRTDTNEGLELQSFDFYIYRDGRTVNLGTITDDRSEVELGTTLVDSETNDHVSTADSEVTLVDTVSYKGARVGKEYTVTGTLYNQETGGKILSNGKEVTASTTFTAEKADGTVDVTFTFDASLLQGTSVVAFEDLYEGKIKVGSHADLSDEGQTVHFPKIGTTLIDSETQDHVSNADSEVTLVDTVAYSNLIVGKEYTVNGELYDQETGESIGVKGSTTFTAEKTDGTVEVTFTFDASKLQGKSVVAFEDVEYNKIKVATHADITDESQTVDFPKIGTTLIDSETQDHIAVADEQVTLVDTVKYENLTVGKEYTVKGELYDQSTGESIGVTGETTFTATAKSGTVDVTFTFDASKLEGTSVVAFEDVYRNGIKVASHADIEDEGQTVHFPKIGTTLLDKKTATHEALAEPETTFVDTVKYTNLIVGKEYTVTGTLYNKDTGEAIVDSTGSLITASKTFTAEKSDGSVDVTFTFDSSLLAGNTIVAFEDVYKGTVKVGTHADITDEEQTVYIPKLETTLVDSETQDHVSMATEKVTLTDTVAYTNLQAGKEYTVKGELYDQSTGESIGVTGETTFTPTEANGTVDVTFTFDASKLEGTSVVAFEDLYRDGKKVAMHADIEDEGQTVHFPKLGTTLVDQKTQQKVVSPDTEVTLVDTVKYTNLIVGKEYTVTGELYDKETGESIGVTGETTFTAEKSDGSVEVTFTFDASKLAGQDIVAFEDLYHNGKKIGTHSDINDEAQTVTVLKPEIGTTLVESGTGSKQVEAANDIQLTDTVSYSGLEVGREYTVTGELYNRETGESLGVTAEATFTPTESTGSVDVTFTIDTTNLAGKHIVAFETLESNGEFVAEHKDINDEGQTVVVNEAPQPTTRTSNNPNTGVGGLDYKLLGSVAVAILALAGGSFWYYKKQKSAK